MTVTENKGFYYAEDAGNTPCCAISGSKYSCMIKCNPLLLEMTLICCSYPPGIKPMLTGTWHEKWLLYRLQLATTQQSKGVTSVTSSFHRKGTTAKNGAVSS
jgi:hypothetical protein